jgi:hypothetical protein
MNHMERFVFHVPTTEGEIEMPKTEKPAVTGEQAARQRAIEALWKPAPDVEAIAAALRDLDEPRPRAMAPFLVAIVRADRMASHIIAQTEGAAAREHAAELTMRAVARSIPSAAEVAAHAAAIIAAQTEYNRQFRDRTTHEAARIYQGHIRAFCPALFASVPGDVEPLTCDFAELQAAWGTVQNWRITNNLETEIRDGWLYSKLPPAPTPRRRRVVAVQK